MRSSSAVSVIRVIPDVAADFGESARTAQFGEWCKKRKVPFKVVGGTGIEPVTPAV
jgi:hypothetical protein